MGGFFTPTADGGTAGGSTDGSFLLPSRTFTFQFLKVVLVRAVKEAFKAFFQDWALQRTAEQRTSYFGLTNLAAAGPGRLSGLRGGSCRTPLSWLVWWDEPDEPG